MKKVLFLSFSSVLISGLLLAGSAPAQMSGKSPHGMSPMGHSGKPAMGGHRGGKSGYGGPGGMGHIMGPRWKDTLTDKQKKMADEMHLKLKKDLVVPKAALELKKQELHLLIVQDRPDKKAVDEKVGEIMKLKAAIKMKKIAHKIEMRGMLTPEQRVSFDMMILGGGHKK